MNPVPSIRHAIPGLRRRPAMSLAIVLMLALGIAAVTVMFGLFDAVLLRGLPYHQPEELVKVWGRPADPSLGGDANSRWWTSWADFQDYRERQRVFQDLAAYTEANIVVRGEELRPRRVGAARVSAALFPLLGAQVRRGRLFTEEEDRWGSENVVLLSSGLARELALNESELGKATIHLDDRPHRIIGIMPETFAFPRGARFWVPLAQNAARDNRGQHRLQLIGRLRPDQSLEGAQAELAALAAALEAEHPESNRNRSAWIEPLADAMTGSFRHVMSLLLAACVLLMAVVAVNVAGLLMVQAIRRRREVAIRRSLGASRGRLLAQFLAEAGLLGAAGALAGLVLAALLMQLLPTLLPTDLPFAERAAINPRVATVAMATGLIATLLFGLLPAIRSIRVSGNGALKSGVRSTDAGPLRLGAGATLLLVQLSLAFALVTTTLMLLDSARDQLTQPLGFEARQRLAFQIYLPTRNYHPIEQPRKVNGYYQRLLDEVGSVAGVHSAAVASIHPLEPNWSTSYWIEGREQPASGVLPEARFRPVGPDYFETVGIPLLSGRPIMASDGFDAPGVVVINEAMAELHFQDRNPVGQYLTKNAWWEERQSSRWKIVGVVADVRFDGPGQPAAPALYFSQAQWPLEDRYLLVHAEGDPAMIVRPIQERIWSLDSTVPADVLTFLQDARAEGLRDRLIATTLVSAAAAVVLLIAVSGLYAVLSFTVGMEQRQIGIRMAVGARPATILLHYLGRGLLLALGAAVLGGLLHQLALATVSALASQLGAVGPLLLSASVAAFLAASLLGALAPAYRAARLSPMLVLREE